MKTKLNNKAMKPVKFSNPRTGEIWICEDVSNRKKVDGVDFIQVHLPDRVSRTVWIALDTVVKVK